MAINNGLIRLSRRPSTKQLLWLGLLGAIIGAYLVIKSFAAAETANIWVDLDGGTCKRDANGANYLSSTACGSLDDAYIAASPGDLVLIKGSTGYGDQTIHDMPAKDGTAWNGTTGIKPVTFRAASGETVIANDLTTRASNLIVDGVNTTISDADGVGEPTIIDAHDVTFQNLHGRSLYTRGASYNILVKNVEVGPRTSSAGGSISTEANGGDDPNHAAQPHDVVYDNVYFHDFQIPADGGPTTHLDCLHIFYHYNVTVKNSRFRNCGMPNNGYGILLGSNGASYPEHDLFENNIFDGQIAGFALRGGTGEDFNDVIVRYNSGGLITTQTSNVLANVKFIANAASDIGPCRANTYSYNVSTSTSCSSTDLKADPMFNNPSVGDFTLKAGSPAVGHGSPNEYPPADIVGTLRPQGSSPDAGAYEVSSGPSASLWVNSTAGASPSKCSPACPYDPTHAYGSINAAYQASQPGEVILIKGGIYPSQHVAVINGRGSTRTSILVEPNAVATITGGLSINADFVTVGGTDPYSLKVNGTVDVDSDYNDVQQNSFPYNNQVEGVTVKNIDASRLDIRNTKDLTSLNSDWGPINNTQSVHFDGQFAPANNPSATANFNTVIDGGNIHDSTRDNGNVHTECVAAWSVVKLTIRNVHFWNCAVYNISATRIGSSTDAQPSDYLIENNIFEGTDDVTVGGKSGFYSNLLSAWEFGGFGIKLIHNYMEQQFELDQDDQNKLLVANNILPKDFNCSDTTYSGNAMVRSGGACAGNTTIPSLASQVVSAQNNDFHLVSAAGAIGAGNIAYTNITDKDGFARDSHPDAGPYEYRSGSSAKTGDLNSDGIVNIVDLGILLSHFGASYPEGDLSTSTNSIIDVSDISVLLSHFGS